MLTGMLYQYIPGGRARMFYPHTHFPVYCIYHIGVGINSVSFNSKGDSQGLDLGQADVDAHVLFVKQTIFPLF